MSLLLLEWALSGQHDRAFTSEIILLYGRISIRFAEVNSGNAIHVNISCQKIEVFEHLPIVSLFEIKLFVSSWR